MVVGGSFAGLREGSRPVREHVEELFGRVESLAVRLVERRAVEQAASSRVWSARRTEDDAGFFSREGFGVLGESVGEEEVVDCFLRHQRRPLGLVYLQVCVHDRLDLVAGQPHDELVLLLRREVFVEAVQFADEELFFALELDSLGVFLQAG